MKGDRFDYLISHILELPANNIDVINRVGLGFETLSEIKRVQGSTTI